MTSGIRHLTFDCRDPYLLAQFWATALGYVDDPENPNEPGDPEALIIDPKGLHPGLLFIPVPEPKTTKNRLHLDLVPDVGREVAVDELLAIGATLVDDRRNADGTGWAVLADPEGNEVCIERAEPERPDWSPPVDTGERAMPLVHAADERTLLEGMLDWYRAGVVTKVIGTGALELAATPLRSATSIGGVLKHLALVEDSWFTHRVAGAPEPEPWAGTDWEADPDWEFHSAAEDTLEELLTLYEEACARSREVSAAHDLDHTATDERGRTFTLRFVLLHLIEETARHLGHLDVLRELLDGTTGE